MESHLAFPEAAARGFPILFITGNAIVDKYAGEAADLETQPLHARASIIHWIGATASRIRARAAAALQDVLAKDVRARVEPNTLPRRDRLAEARAAPSHKVKVRGKKWACGLCGQGTLATSKTRLIRWMSSPCEPPTTARQADYLAKVARLQLGSQGAHASHDLWRDLDLGLHFCGACGAVAKDFMRGLARPCPRELTPLARKSSAPRPQELTPLPARAHPLSA